MGVVLGASLLLAGCATANKMSPPDTKMDKLCFSGDERQARKLEEAARDGEIAALLDQETSIRAKFPTVLALAKVRPSLDYRGKRHGFDLETVDGQELESWRKAAKGQLLIADFRPVVGLALLESEITIASLREAAARLKCELLLVYTQADSSVDNYNDAAALYCTLIGIWLVPGDVVEHKTVTQAVLVESRTGTILGTAVGSSHLKGIVPLAYKNITEDKFSQQAPAKALADMQANCAKLLQEIASRTTGTSNPASR
jgi:hypothetical protein